MIEQPVAPGVVEMYDDAGEAYLVDETLSVLLENRRVWTDPETEDLMIEEVRYRQTQSVSQYMLANWWYRIMSLRDLPDTLNIGFLDGNKRNCTYDNLVRLAKGSESATHDSTDNSAPNVP